MFEAKDKVILITGGAKGIGAETVKAFLEEGAKHIAVLDIDDDSGLALENDLNKKYGTGKVKYTSCDVSDEKALINVFDTVYKEKNYIDVVINNAGIVSESNAALIKKQILINYGAVVHGTVKAIELMHKSKGGTGGTVINISSAIALSQMSPTLFVYAGCKSAVLQFSNCIGKAEYYELTGVRVLTICFGFTETTILNQFQSFCDDTTNFLKVLVENSVSMRQGSDFAAKELIQAFKKGKSGSTWLINNRPAQDITDTVDKAYNILCDVIKV